MGKRRERTVLVVAVLTIALAVAVFIFVLPRSPSTDQPLTPQPRADQAVPQTSPEHEAAKWIERARAVTRLFHRVYTPCWEGAYGALGDAHLFLVTGDSSLLRFHIFENDLTRMCTGTWVDDAAWVCIAELTWWKVTGRSSMSLVADAVRRYDDARKEGRLSSHEGFWSWYNWPPHARVNERIFTNTNMNQMVTVACMLYEATGDKRFLDDALLVWNGDDTIPGIEQTFYRGDGRWEGRPGQAAFGKQLPWEGTGYCAVAAALYSVTKNERYRTIAAATARRIMDPATGWVDPNYFYQLRMDGNGAFVHFLLEAYAIAPDELHDLLPKIETMLEHVWTNNHGRAVVTLHREIDHGIRNGWNPRGGEDGYRVGDIGTVHAQGEAARAFGVFAYYIQPHRRQE
jgi:hypothetical protein